MSEALALDGGCDGLPVAAFAVAGACPAAHDADDGEILAALPDLSRVVAHYFRDPHDREDMMQEVVYRLVAKRTSFRGAAPFRHWALAVASRVCLSRLRRRRILSYFGFGAEDGPEPAAAAADPAEEAGRSERRALVRRAIKELKDEDREVILLCDILDKKDHEVAPALGLKPGALRVRRHRARTRLKEILEGSGYEHD